MTAADVLADAARAGFTVSVEDGRLVVRPGSRLDASLRGRLAAARAELVALLTAPPAVAAPVAAVGDAVPMPPFDDPVPSGGRDLLGWLDMLGPLKVDALSVAVQWPRGAVVGLLYRLRRLGFVTETGGWWRLTDRAEAVALRPRDADDVPVNYGSRHGPQQAPQPASPALPPPTDVSSLHGPVGAAHGPFPGVSDASGSSPDRAPVRDPGEMFA